MQRINADLANDLGNLAQRSLSMIAKNCGGKVPKPGKLTAADEAILASADALLARVEAAIDAFAIHRALEMIWAVVADANRYFASEEPWAHKKTDPERMETILYVTAEVTREIAILVQPVMPESAGKLLDQLGVPRFGARLRRAWSQGAAETRDEAAPAFARLPAPCRSRSEAAAS